MLLILMFVQKKSVLKNYGMWRSDFNKNVSSFKSAYKNHQVNKQFVEF